MKLTKEDIFKFGTREEVKFLKEIINQNPEQKKDFNDSTLDKISTQQHMKETEATMREYLKTANALGKGNDLKKIRTDNELDTEPIWYYLIQHIKGERNRDLRTRWDIDRYLKKLQTQLAEWSGKGG